MRATDTCPKAFAICSEEGETATMMWTNDYMLWRLN